MIEVRDLASRQGDFLLRGVSFSVADGECLALIGPSGAGKTVLLECLLGLHRPDEGEVLVDGIAPWSQPPEQRHAAFLPQGLALFPHLSVAENVGFCLRHLAPAARRARCLELARMLHIEGLLSRSSVESLSGGERQRVALARALASYPRHLYLDEPFNALDTATRRSLQRELGTLRRSLNLTVVVVTHDLDEAHTLADRFVLLREGRVVQQGSPDGLKENPRDAWTARFLLLPDPPGEEAEP